MIRKIIRQVRTRAKEAYAALKSIFRSIAPGGTPRSSFSRMVSGLVVLGSVRTSSTTGKQVRKPKDHAPVFSLYTFFGNRS